MGTAVRPAVSASTRQHFGAAERLAFWSSVAAAITSAGFGVGTVITLLAFKQQSWTGDISAFARNYDPVQMALTVVPSILLAPSFLIVVAAVHETTPTDEQIWTRLAQMFAVLYVAVVGINYFLQLTVIRQDLIARNTEAMALFAMGNPVSIFWALEVLGYFWQGVAAALLAIVLTGGGLAAWMRWMLVGVFITGALGVVAALQGIAFTSPIFAAGAGAWTIVFPASMILFAVYFRRRAAV